MYAGASRQIRLVELGPGRGTLMHDILRVRARIAPRITLHVYSETRQVFSQFAAARSVVREIHLVETSPPMRSAQQEKLGPIAQQNGWVLNWHDSVDGVPHDAAKFTLLVAHEFFDALPFHLLQVSSSAARHPSP